MSFILLVNKTILKSKNTSFNFNPFCSFFPLSHVWGLWVEKENKNYWWEHCLLQNSLILYTHRKLFGPKKSVNNPYILIYNLANVLLLFNLGITPSFWSDMSRINIGLFLQITGLPCILYSFKVSKNFAFPDFSTNPFLIFNNFLFRHFINLHNDQVLPYLSTIQGRARASVIQCLFPLSLSVA